MRISSTVRPVSIQDRNKLDGTKVIKLKLLHCPAPVLDLELQASTCAVDSCFEKSYLGKEFAEIVFCCLRNDETFSKYVLLVPFIFISSTQCSYAQLLKVK